MKKLIKGVLLGWLAWLPMSQASAAWTGRFDLGSKPTMGLYQSFDSEDQAFGVSKHLWSFNKDTQEVLKIGTFAGVQKPMFSQPNATTRFLGGGTVSVPGSTLDWALGTKMGDQWVPALKAGVLAAYDLSRPNALHAKPNFYGVGLVYPLGG